MKRSRNLTESAAEEAKEKGLVYGGFGGWIDPKTREVKARTVDGELIWTSGGDEGGNGHDLGRIFIVDFDVKLTGDNPAVARYVTLIKSLMGHGTPIFILVIKGTEQHAAKALQSAGITSEIKVATLVADSPEKVSQFVEKKIQEGFTDVHFFDDSETNINAVESLVPKYNRSDIKIAVHAVGHK